VSRPNDAKATVGRESSGAITLGEKPWKRVLDAL